MFVVDAAGRATGWAVLHAPIQSASRRALFAGLRGAGTRFVGMTSFLTWPALDEEDPLDYDGVCEAWCHCFRRPATYLPAARPSTRLAWSDFTDPARIDPAHHAADAGPVPRFDFVYVAAEPPWKRDAKNWALGRACVHRLCRAGWRGLVIDAPDASLAGTAGLTSWPWLPYGHFLRVLGAAGLLLVPSETDPSPRVLAEALCLDVPVVVNRRILGGWNYVTPATGAFFDGADDVVDAATAVMSGRCTPRTWWRAHHGPERAGRRLHTLLAGLDPALGRQRPGGPLRLGYRAEPPSPPSPAGDGRGWC